MKDIKNFEAQKYRTGTEEKTISGAPSVFSPDNDPYKNIESLSNEEKLKLFKQLIAPRKVSLSYSPSEDGIFTTTDVHGIQQGNIYVTSLSFVQEPEFKEGANASEISQYPLECLLDEFGCWVSDFYEELNTPDSQICYQEFASDNIGSIRKLRSIIGKHVYIKWGEKEGKIIIE